MPTVHVIGLGRSGIAAARLLKRQGWQVEVSDSRQTPALQSQQQLLEAEGIAVQLNYDFDLQTLASVGLRVPAEIVISPGVPWQSPALIAARQAGIPVRGKWKLLGRPSPICRGYVLRAPMAKQRPPHSLPPFFKQRGTMLPPVAISAIVFAKWL